MKTDSATENNYSEGNKMSATEDQATRDEAASKRAKQRRGFAAMDKEAHRKLARAGGVAAHAAGLAHRFTSDQAREAGKKGGATTATDREHMRAIGRKGGLGKRGFRKETDDERWAAPSDGGSRGELASVADQSATLRAAGLHRSSVGDEPAKTQTRKEKAHAK